MRSRESLLIGALAIGLVAAPDEAIGAVVGGEWAVEVVRWAGLVLIGGAVVWRRAGGSGGVTQRRLRRWLTTAAVMAMALVFTGNGLFLILALAVVMGGVLGALVEQAVAASDALRTRLERGTRGA